MRFPEDVDARVSEFDAPESDARFRTMADTAPVFIWTSGTDNKCDWFNATWQAFTGRGLEQEVGDGWRSGIHPDDLARVLEADFAAFKARAPFKAEYRLRRHDGAYRWVLDTGVPRFASDGSFAGYIGTSLDIHDRRMAEEELSRREQQFVSLAESLPDMIARYDREGRYLYVNSATTALTGKPAEFIASAWKEYRDRKVRYNDHYANGDGIAGFRDFIRAGKATHPLPAPRRSEPVDAPEDWRAILEALCPANAFNQRGDSWGQLHPDVQKQVLAASAAAGTAW